MAVVGQRTSEDGDTGWMHEVSDKKGELFTPMLNTKRAKVIGSEFKEKISSRIVVLVLETTNRADK